MSQSFANINSFPIELVFDGRRKERWVWPSASFKPFRGYSRFLRYPGPKDGLGYRMIRKAVIVVLQAREAGLKILKPKIAASQSLVEVRLEPIPLNYFIECKATRLHMPSKKIAV